MSIPACRYCGSASSKASSMPTTTPSCSMAYVVVPSSGSSRYETWAATGSSASAHHRATSGCDRISSNRAASAAAAGRRRTRLPLIRPVIGSVSTPGRRLSSNAARPGQADSRVLSPQSPRVVVLLVRVGGTRAPRRRPRGRPRGTGRRRGRGRRGRRLGGRRRVLRLVRVGEPAAEVVQQQRPGLAVLVAELLGHHARHAFGDAGLGPAHRGQDRPGQLVQRERLDLVAERQVGDRAVGADGHAHRAVAAARGQPQPFGLLLRGLVTLRLRREPRRPVVHPADRLLGVPHQVPEAVVRARHACTFASAVRGAAASCRSNGWALPSSPSRYDCAAVLTLSAKPRTPSLAASSASFAFSPVGRMIGGRNAHSSPYAWSDIAESAAAAAVESRSTRLSTWLACATSSSGSTSKPPAVMRSLPILVLPVADHRRRHRFFAREEVRVVALEVVGRLVFLVVFLLAAAGAGTHAAHARAARRTGLAAHARVPRGGRFGLRGRDRKSVV